MRKEWRIIDTTTKQVIKTFDNQEEGYKEMRKQGEELKAQGKQDNLIYKEYRVKKAEDLKRYMELSQEERIEKYLAGKKWNEWGNE